VQDPARLPFEIGIAFHKILVNLPRVVLPVDQEVHVRVVGGELSSFGERDPAQVLTDGVGWHFPPQTKEAKVVLGRGPVLN